MAAITKKKRGGEERGKEEGRRREEEGEENRHDDIKKPWCEKPVGHPSCGEAVRQSEAKVTLLRSHRLYPLSRYRHRLRLHFPLAIWYVIPCGASYATRSQPTRNGALGGPLGALPKPLGSERLDDLMFVCASLYIRGHTRPAKVSLG